MLFFERRAQELMLNPTDKAAYLRMMDQDINTQDYSAICPGCGAKVSLYESKVLSHVRTCDAFAR